MEGREGDMVKVGVVLAGDDGPGAESLWATPVAATDAGGTYRLENNGFLVALAVGDQVRAELNGDGSLQVVDIVEPAPALLTVTVVADGTEGSAISAMAELFRDRGAVFSEGAGGRVLVTAWSAAVDEDAVERAVTVASRSAGVQVVELVVVPPQERTREALSDEVVFELDRAQHFPPTGTRYWAADDPYWAEHGMGDPEMLAFVQQLASHDPRVARALERGQQDRVVLFIQRLAAPDPSQLPPLDGPLFED